MSPEVMHGPEEGMRGYLITKEGEIRPGSWDRDELPGSEIMTFKDDTGHLVRFVFPSGDES